MSTIWAFGQRENKRLYDCESLRGNTKNIIDFEKKKCCH